MLPNFLLIGAAKAGTTALHMSLDQHPDIFMSRLKEPGFFVFEGTDGHVPMIRNQPFITDLASYEALFEAAVGAKVIGESSPFYLDFASPEVVDRIRTLLPSVRLLVVLRQPVDQAYSRFVMWQRLKLYPGISFREKFLADLESFHQLDYDFHGQEALVKSYHDRLQLFVDMFEPEQIKIVLYDDYVADSPAFMTEIYQFMGVDSDFHNDLSVRVNQGRFYRFSSVSAIMNRPNPIRWLARRLVPEATRIAFREALLNRLSKPAPKLDPVIRAELTDLLAEEISNLERLTGHDLSAWRSAPAGKSL